MEEYTKETYTAKFGAEMWEEKVARINEGAAVEKVYATGSGNIFMIILADEA